jgi:transcriptional regulator with XRE-family HTH domain
MNFGERLRQLRTQKNLTQPQLAQAIGIEQSYLSKLENDKSIPGADIFQSIIRALQTDVASFLQGVDESVVHRELRQVPEVANHLSSRSTQRVHDVKKWLYGSALAGMLGLTLFVAGYKDMLMSGWQYSYVSDGIVHADEPTDIFDTRQRWLGSKVRAGEIDEPEAARREAEIISRMKTDWLTVREHRGEWFVAKVPGGLRAYHLMNNSYQEPTVNRILTVFGLLLAFASLFGFIVEWRLRQLKTG